MLTAALDKILQRAIDGRRDVTTDMSQIFESANPAVTKSQRFEFSKAVLDRIFQDPTGPISNHFRGALSCLRDLTPSLNRQESSPIDVVARVEKYAVKYALLVANEPRESVQRSNAAIELEVTLRLLFAARSNAMSKQTRRRLKPSRSNGSGDVKENTDPQLRKSTRLRRTSQSILPDKPSQILNCTVYPGASDLPRKSILPSGDSSLVTRVISGALILLQENLDSDLTLAQRVYSISAVIIPWLEHLQSFSEPSNAEYVSAFKNRLCLTIQYAIQTDSCMFAKTRALAITLTLCDMPLNLYAQDVRKSVLKLVNSNNLGLLHQETLDVVVAIYENAVEHALTFPENDPFWFHEDVSVWLDHVAHVWGRINARTLPKIFEMRTKVAQRAKLAANLVSCFQLQIDLFNIGAYGRKALAMAVQGESDRIDPLWANARKHILAIKTPNCFETQNRWPSDFANIELSRCSYDDVTFYLRFLRVIDPLRATLVSQKDSSKASCSDCMVIYHRHISTTLIGLKTLSRGSRPQIHSDDTSDRHLLSGMTRMAGGAVEACKELVRLYWLGRDVDGICNVVSSVALLMEKYALWCDDQPKQWWKWFLSYLRNSFDAARHEAKRSRPEDADEDQRLISLVLSHVESSIQTYCDVSSLSEPRIALLRLTRKIYVSGKAWLNAFEISIKILSIECSGRDNMSSLAREVSFPFMEDLVRAVSDCSCNLTELGGLLQALSEVQLNLIFSLASEYQCYLWTNLEIFRTRESFLETLYGLRLGCLLVLEQIPSENECFLRRTYRNWLRFSFQKEFVHEKQSLNILEPEEVEICLGHMHNSTVDLDHGPLTCFSSQNPLLHLLCSILKSIHEERYVYAGALFDEMEELQAVFSMESLSREFLLLMGEILDWVCLMMALREYDSYAWRAGILAEEARANLGIPRYTHPLLFELALRMASLSKFEWYFNSRSEKVEIPISAQFQMMCAESNYVSAVEFLTPEDQDLPPHQKAFALESGRGDITSALENSHKALKSAVRQLVCTKDSISCNLEGFNIGGAVINISTNTCTELGQRNLFELLRLVTVLFQYAHLYFEAEYIQLGQYYMERCFTLASRCLPSESYLYQSVACAYHAKIKSDLYNIVLRDYLNIFKNSSKERSFRNVVIEQAMWSTMVTMRYRHEGAATESELLKALECCESIISIEQHENDDWAKRIEAELIVLKSNILMQMGEMEKVRGLLKSVFKRRLLCRAQVRIQYEYNLAKTLWIAWKENTSEKKTAKKRVTRSRSRQCTAAAIAAINERTSAKAVREAEGAIDNAIDLLSGDFDVPWICRRAYGLQTLKVKSGQDDLNGEMGDCIATLAQKIGASFNVRWRFGMKMKLEQFTSHGSTEEADRIRQAETLFREMTVGGLEELAQLLARNNCMVVGINVDEEARNLVFWRISGSKLSLESRPVPSNGPMSVQGVHERIRKVVSTRQDTPEPRGGKLTNKEKSEWWADRFRLDDDLGTIVKEVEDEWIGEAEYLFDIPEELCLSPGSGEVGQVVLLVDTVLEGIPWESVGSFRERVISVTRCPSLAFLEHHLRWPLGVLKNDDMFYVINPTGEFTKTEGRFNDLTRSQTAWSGFCGKCSREEVNAKYVGQRIYMYCGHGTGVAFLSPRRFERAADAPVTLLMGCSSVKPDNVDVMDEESNGASIDFLIRGAPAVVGTLWDVSDGEIDRFTLSLLSLWAGAEISKDSRGEYVSLAEAVARSRSACRTPFLVGAACVVVGAPNIRIEADQIR